MWNQAQIYNALKFDAPLPILHQISTLPQAPPTPWLKQQTTLLKERAQVYLSTPIPPLPYHLFKLYWETGDRSQYQKPYFERRGRLLVFAVLYWLESSCSEWKHALEDTIWEICAEPFWCIPAHFQSHDNGMLDFSEYSTQLDLFSAETAFALAETLALCANHLDERIVQQIQLQLERRVFAPFCDAAHRYRFESMNNNWSAVCAGAIGSAAIYMVHDRVRLTSILSRCLSSVNLYLSSFGDDGVSVEGVNYWTYGFGFLVCFADLLSQRTNAQLDLFQLAKVQAIAECQQHYYLTENYTVSFADGCIQSGFRMGLGCFLQKRYASAALPKAEYADSVLKDSCYRFCLAVRDYLWYYPETKFGLADTRSVWLPDAQWLISCSNGVNLAAKAGNNNESHNHNDCGSFILYKNGAPLICDLGAGLYDAAYFGPHRYDIFINASRSHNVAMPAGCEQKFGAEYACSDVDVLCSEKADILQAELQRCYDCADLTHYHRRFVHNKQDAQVLLTDTIVFSQPHSVTEIFLSETPITLQEGCAVFQRGNESVVLHYDAQHLTAQLLQENYFAHSGEKRTAYLLHLVSSEACEHHCSITIQA